MSETTSETRRLRQLLGRLRLGDTVRYETSQRDPATVEVVELTMDDGYEKIFVEGPRGGRYLLMPETPDGLGNNTPPEAFWVNPEPDKGSNTYELVTRGAIQSVSIVAERGE